MTPCRLSSRQADVARSTTNIPLCTVSGVSAAGEQSSNAQEDSCYVQGCMKSGQVLTDRRCKRFEPKFWHF